MINRFDISQMARELISKLPDMPDSLHQEVENTIRQSLQLTLSKMDLVTREEFDVQAAVLARTREKLELLEKQVNDLEK